MKCISLKLFLLIITLFFLFTTFLTIFITHLYHKNLGYITDKDEINFEEIESEDNTLHFEEYDNEDEYNYIEFLQEKYNDKKLIALTFDDGPSKYTHELIDELNKRKIHVTFFVLGENIKKYPDTLKFAIDSGNEIGIHSYKHKLFTKLSTDEINEQITLTQDLIYSISPIDITYIRVPYGSINTKVENVLISNNLVNILWDVDSLDWKFKNKTKTYNYMLRKITGNDIVLMHDTFKTSISASLLLIDKLTSDGYVFVTVSELIMQRQIDIMNKK